MLKPFFATVGVTRAALPTCWAPNLTAAWLTAAWLGAAAGTAWLADGISARAAQANEAPSRGARTRLRAAVTVGISSMKKVDPNGSTARGGRGAHSCRAADCSGGSG